LENHLRSTLKEYYPVGEERAVELFRYRLRTEDGRQFEYVLRAKRSAVTRDKAVAIAMDWMLAFSIFTAWLHWLVKTLQEGGG
jgi:hypothetical protein